MLFTVFYFKLWVSFCSAEQNRFDSFGRRPSEEHLRNIILNFG